MSDKREIKVNVKGSEEEDAEQQQAANAQTDEVDKQQSESDVAPEDQLSEAEKLKRQLAETDDRYLRLMADFDNFKKRSARQFDDMIRSANDALVAELLEIVDNFERALNHGDNDADADAFRKGTELIYNQMLDLLKRHDVTPIDALGKPFDPNLHEALMQIESDEYDDGIVALEMTRGYRHGQRVIRHTKVGVSRGKPTGELDDTDEQGKQA